MATNSQTSTAANNLALPAANVIRRIVAREVYGYVVVTTIAVLIACIGVFFIYREGKKDVEKRNPFYIIFGICIASLGSLLMVLTILFLATRS